MILVKKLVRANDQAIGPRDVANSLMFEALSSAGYTRTQFLLGNASALTPLGIGSRKVHGKAGKVVSLFGDFLHALERPRDISTVLFKYKLLPITPANE